MHSHFVDFVMKQLICGLLILMPVVDTLPEETSNYKIYIKSTCIALHTSPGHIYIKYLPALYLY